MVLFGLGSSMGVLLAAALAIPGSMNLSLKMLRS
jgi:hypothetical protein